MLYKHQDLSVFSQGHKYMNTLVSGNWECPSCFSQKRLFFVLFVRICTKKKIVSFNLFVLYIFCAPDHLVWRRKTGWCTTGRHSQPSRSSWSSSLRGWGRWGWHLLVSISVCAEFLPSCSFSSCLFLYLLSLCLSSYQSDCCLSLYLSSLSLTLFLSLSLSSLSLSLSLSVSLCLYLLLLSLSTLSLSLSLSLSPPTPYPSFPSTQLKSNCSSIVLEWLDF